MLNFIYRWLAKRKLKVSLEAYRRRTQAEIDYLDQVAARCDDSYQKCRQEFAEGQGKRVKKELVSLYHEAQQHEQNAEVLRRRAESHRRMLEVEEQKIQMALK